MTLKALWVLLHLPAPSGLRYLRAFALAYAPDSVRGWYYSRRRAH